MTTRDPNVWRELTPLDSGFVPAIKREYLYVAGGARAQVELQERCRVTGRYPIVPVFAHNVMLGGRLADPATDLVPIERILPVVR